MKVSFKIQKNNNIPLKINNYIIEQKLFEINISSFYSATNTYIKEKVLIRVFPRNLINKNLEEITSINNEVHLLKLINHKNILRLYEIIESKEFIFLIYEYFDCDSLSNFIKNKKLNEKQILTILYKISTSMIYIHHVMRIGHLTLNLDSILIDKDLNIKIINFKYSCIYMNDIDNLTFNNDMFIFNCPEIHAKQKFNPELADVYSCGILVYYLYVGELPFSSKRRIINDEQIMKGEYTLPEKTSKKMLKVITSLMEIDPTKRKKFKDILNGDWFNDISNKNEEKTDITGLNIFHEKYPIDENVMKVCEQYKLNKNDLLNYLNNNNFNSFTSLYKQIEKFLNSKGIKTLCDLYSDKFIEYINNKAFHYDNKETKSNHEKAKNEVQNKEKINGRIANIKEIHTEVFEGLKILKKKYDNGNYKKVKKEDFATMSKRRKSQLYALQLINNLNKRREENKTNNVNIDPKNYILIKEVNTGNQSKEKNEKNKNDKYKKSESEKLDEESKKDNKNIEKKISKKIRERRKSSIIREMNLLGSNGKNQRRSSVDKNLQNFDEFLVNFYQEEEKKNKKEEKKSNKSLKSFKSKKSFKSNKNDEKEIIKKDYKKINSFKKDNVEKESSNKEKKVKLVEFVNINDNEKSNIKKKDEEKSRKPSENKDVQKGILVKSKSIKNLKIIDNNKNEIKEVKKNKEEIERLMEIQRQKDIEREREIEKEKELQKKRDQERERQKEKEIKMGIEKEVEKQRKLLEEKELEEKNK